MMHLLATNTFVEGLDNTRVKDKVWDKDSAQQWRALTTVLQLEIFHKWCVQQ